jgi:hypothetical protein
MTRRTCPRSPRGAADCSAAKPPIWDRPRVGAVVVEQVALNVGLDGLAEKGKFRDRGHSAPRWDRSRHGAFAPPAATKDSREACFRWPPDRPKTPAAAPKAPPQALVVGDRVLDDEGLDPVRTREHHAKAHGAVIVLRVKRVAREPEHFGEINHDLGAAIERVGEFFRVRPIAVPEALDNPARRGDSGRKAGRTGARTSATKREGRAARAGRGASFGPASR